MDEYIRREDAIKCIEGQCVNGKMWGNDESEGTLIDAYSAIDDLMEIPPGDVAPVQHARWRYYHKKNIAVCTECSFERNLDANFGRAASCPNCGSKMDG